jgi:hypothetical protein
MASEPRTRTFTIPDPELDEECPLVPDGATEWEAQAIAGAWREVHRSAAEVMGRVAYEATHPDRSNGTANDASALAQMHAAKAALSARIQGAHHRVRWADRQGVADRG